MECQLCGNEAESLNKVKIEGAVLKVCGSCAEMGEEVNTGGGKKKKRKKKKKRRRKRNQEVLADDYGTRVKKARESKELSIKELADSLNEKASVIRKIEGEKFKPDKTLAGKLSRELDVELYTTPEAWDQETDSGDSRKATLGDVADIND